MNDLLRLIPPELVTLSEAHEEFRVKHRGGLPVEMFTFEVCNTLMALPQDKLGYQWHMPVSRATKARDYGWGECTYLLVLPGVSNEDVVANQALRGRHGAFLRDQLKESGIDLAECMVTHAVRFPMALGATSYGQKHKTSCQTYVRADAFACKPKVIITFGADALKCFFGRDAKMDQYRGSVEMWGDTPVIATVSPATFATSTGGLDVFRSELTRAVQVALKGFTPAPRTSPFYRVCSNADEVEDLEQQLIGEKATMVAIDTEFGNDTGREEDGYLLTFQLAWGPGKAALIKFRGERGTIIHGDEQLARIKAAVVRMMTRDGVRLIGHHLRVDVDKPWHEGMDFDFKLGTGFDTMLAHWLLYGAEGDASHGLDHLVRKYAAEYGTYWRELEMWLDSEPLEPCEKINKKGEVVQGTRKRSRGDILDYGYRDIPHELLIPYALLDADVTWRIAQHLMLELDQQPKLKQVFETYEMPGSLHLMDVERHGVLQDRERVRQLREIYQKEYDEILAQFIEETNWPDFNPNSPIQRATFLFSKATYKGKVDPPPDAKVLSLTPLYNTDKYPKEWKAIVDASEEMRNSPSTKARTIELLLVDPKNKGNVPLKLLRQLSVLGKFLSTYLLDANPNRHGLPESGRLICNNIWKDGRARGHLVQMTSTGRYSMRSANLQTNPKKQEEAALAVFIDRRFNGMDLETYRKYTDDRKKDELGEFYIPPEQRFHLPSFKSSFVPSPGYAFIEVDFKTAEIAVLAYASQDLTLIAIIDSGRDLHAEVAAEAFQLKMAAELPAVVAKLDAGDKKPYKEWVSRLKSLYPALRNAAKAVNFGMIYGRGPYSLAREISATGAAITSDECQAIIDKFAKKFAKAWAWLQANKNSAIENEYVENPFGFRRYFHGVSQMSDKEQAAAQREASNAPIQGTVAYLLKAAGINLYRLRYFTDLGKHLGFRVLLPIHDAFLIETPIANIKGTKSLLRMAMIEMNKIPGTPYSLELDIEVYRRRWGEHDEEAPERKAA